MWEKFKNWFASDNFVWFMLGWTGTVLLYEPSILNACIVAFWIWVVFME